jgi:predicted nucleotidyltransferase
MSNVPEINLDCVREIAERFQLDLILLFGSRAKGRARWHSDYDVAVLDASHPLTHEEQLKLAGEFTLLLRTDDVDLVFLRRAKPLLRYNAVRECIVLYEREPLLYRHYRWQACKMWEDSRWLYNLKRRRIEKFLQSRGLR